MMYRKNWTTGLGNESKINLKRRKKMKKRKIRICYTCCDSCHTAHRTKTGAFLHWLFIRVTHK
ncbi:Uncharacterised protein [uncultured archaeon]|nr:Uncharacterised protein [uncultured archaeon]